MSSSYEVYPSLETLLDRALALVLENLNAAIATRDRFTLALAGGNTPKPLYEKLAQQDLPWEKCHIFWGDERFVPADHPDSNERMARQAWLDHVDIPAANIHPFQTHFDTPAAAAAAHETMLNQFWQTKAPDWPVFDLVLLGMGDDGHTASLFPGTDAVQVCDRWVTVGNKDGNPRLTLTVPVLNSARSVLFLVAGENKKTVLQKIFGPQSASASYPVQLIQPIGSLIWLLDAKAGDGLSLSSS